MTKICLNSRDELLMLDLDKIAYLKANGNYTDLTYMYDQKQNLSISLSKLEEILRQSRPADGPARFVRLGRSLIINQTYLTAVKVLQQKLILSDCEGHLHVLTVPKEVLKKYKEIVAGVHGAGRK